MRQTRRVSFAAPFVMVVGALAAGCGGATKPAPIHDNPPAPQPPPKRTVEECKAIAPDSACDGEERCDIEMDCPQFLLCHDGTWHMVQTACNPPPPR
jgi:hypothetical protein